MAENEGKGEVRRVLGRSFINSGNEQSDNSNIEEQQVQPNTSSQTEQNNNGNEYPSNDENLDDYISQILNTNVQNNEYINDILEENIEPDYPNDAISGQLNAAPNQMQGTLQTSDSTSDILIFLKQHIQAVAGVIFVVLIVVVLSNLEEPSSTTYTPNVTTEQEQQTYTHQDKAYTTTSQNPPSATKPKEVSEVSNTVKSKNIDEFKSLFLKTVQNNWKQDPNQGEIAVEVTLNKNGSIASIKSLDEISTNPEHPDYNFIRAKNAIKKNVSWGSLPSNYSPASLTLQLQFSINKVEIINKPRRTNYSIPKGMVKQENTPNVQNNASQKAQTTKREIPRSTKTDLQKSQDWFFE